MNCVALFLADECGVTSIEYALLATLVALAIIVGATALGGQLAVAFAALTGDIPAV